MKVLLLLIALVVHQPGDSFVIGPGGTWPCSPKQEDVSTLLRWRERMMDERQPDSVMTGFGAALERAKAVLVGTKDRGVIMEVAPGAYRVTVRRYKHTVEKPSYRTAALQSCWISSKAF